MRLIVMPRSREGESARRHTAESSAAIAFPEARCVVPNYNVQYSVLSLCPNTNPLSPAVETQLDVNVLSTIICV